jgi:hypothetical protein
MFATRELFAGLKSPIKETNKQVGRRLESNVFHT